MFSFHDLSQHPYCVCDLKAFECAHFIHATCALAYTDFRCGICRVSGVIRRIDCLLHCPLAYFYGVDDLSGSGFLLSGSDFSIAFPHFLLQTNPKKTSVNFKSFWRLMEAISAKLTPGSLVTSILLAYKKNHTNVEFSGKFHEFVEFVLEKRTGLGIKLVDALTEARNRGLLKFDAHRVIVSLKHSIAVDTPKSKLVVEKGLFLLNLAVDVYTREKVADVLKFLLTTLTPLVPTLASVGRICFVEIVKYAVSNFAEALDIFPLETVEWSCFTKFFIYSLAYCTIVCGAPFKRTFLFFYAKLNVCDEKIRLLAKAQCEILQADETDTMLNAFDRFEHRLLFLTEVMGSVPNVETFRIFVQKWPIDTLSVNKLTLHAIANNFSHIACELVQYFEPQLTQYAMVQFLNAAATYKDYATYEAVLARLTPKTCQQIKVFSRDDFLFGASQQLKKQLVEIIKRSPDTTQQVIEYLHSLQEKITKSNQNLEERQKFANEVHHFQSLIGHDRAMQLLDVE